MAILRPSQQALVDRFKKRRPLSGDKDNVNLTFTTPEVFLPGTEEIFRNGMLLDEGSDADYTRHESGGLGTGYDTIMLTPGPGLLGWERLLANYVIPA